MNALTVSPVQTKDFTTRGVRSENLPFHTNVTRQYGVSSQMQRLSEHLR